MGKKLASPCDFADYLLEEAKVAVVPGEDFGSKEHIRFSYATALEDIEKGCKRIADAVRQAGLRIGPADIQSRSGLRTTPRRFVSKIVTQDSRGDQKQWARELALHENLRVFGIVRCPAGRPRRWRYIQWISCAGAGLDLDPNRCKTARSSEPLSEVSSFASRIAALLNSLHNRQNLPAEPSHGECFFFRLVPSAVSNLDNDINRGQRVAMIFHSCVFPTLTPLKHKVEKEFLPYCRGVEQSGSSQGS